MDSQEISSSVTEDVGILKPGGKTTVKSTILDSDVSRMATVPEAPDNPYYTVRAVPSQGYGCFATTVIKRGTRILAESPLLTVPEADYMHADVEASFSKLSAKNQLLYFTLHSAHSQDPASWPTKIHPSVTGKERERIREQHEARMGKSASLVSIFQTNCMEMNGGAAVYVHTSRFNHSCNPNAYFSWNAAIGKETIHVIREIRKGEQITVSYIDLAVDKEVRLWQLKHYGFVCDCEACTGDEHDPTTFAGKSAVRRDRLRELEEKTDFMRGPYLADAAQSQTFVKQMLEYAKLLREEGSYSPLLAAVYLDLAVVAEGSNDLTTARLCADAAVKVKVDVQGLDCVDIHRYYAVLKGIEDKIQSK